MLREYNVKATKSIARLKKFILKSLSKSIEAFDSMVSQLVFPVF